MAPREHPPPGLPPFETARGIHERLDVGLVGLREPVFAEDEETPREDEQFLQLPGIRTFNGSGGGCRELHAGRIVCRRTACANVVGGPT